jgi:drug/metabolite transporter (DMT)-like permease
MPPRRPAELWTRVAHAHPGELLVGIVFGIFAAVLWGLGDYLIAQLTRRVGSSLALVSIQTLSLLAWLLLLMAMPASAGATPWVWMIVIVTAICHVLGLIFVYRAFEVGTLSIVSPISAGFAVVTAILSLATGERPPASALAGAGLLIAGVIVATRSPENHGSHRGNWAGVPAAILSALAFGTMFWLFYFFVQPALGYAWPLAVLKLGAVGGTLLLYASRPRQAAETKFSIAPGVVLLAVGAAAADTLAWLAYIWGTSSSYATVVTALASLFSVVTVLLAWKFLRERLAIHQWAGVTAVLLGILLVST